MKEFPFALLGHRSLRSLDAYQVTPLSDTCLKSMLAHITSLGDTNSYFEKLKRSDKQPVDVAGCESQSVLGRAIASMSGLFSESEIQSLLGCRQLKTHDGKVVARGIPKGPLREKCVTLSYIQCAALVGALESVWNEQPASEITVARFCKLSGMSLAA